MSDTPRKRLAGLMDGLELPKGFRLTPARQDCLTALGESILSDGELTCSGPHLRIGSLRHGWNLSRRLRRQDKSAFRVMVKAKWITLEVLPDEPGGYWRDRQVIFQEGLKQLALRLGARKALWKERKETLMRAAQKSEEELRQTLWAARRTLSYVTTLGDESGVLAAYRKVRELSSGLKAAEAELARVKQEVGNIPEPSEDDAMAWLMARRLHGKQED